MLPTWRTIYSLCRTLEQRTLLSQGYESSIEKILEPKTFADSQNTFCGWPTWLNRYLNPQHLNRSLAAKSRLVRCENDSRDMIPSICEGYFEPKFLRTTKIYLYGFCFDFSKTNWQYPEIPPETKTQLTGISKNQRFSLSYEKPRFFKIMWMQWNSKKNSRLASRGKFFFFLSIPARSSFLPRMVLVFVPWNKNPKPLFVLRVPRNKFKNLLEGCWSCWRVETKPKTRTTQKSFGVPFSVFV